MWNHNTYPGAACDVPSHLYEFSFEPNPRWSRRYAPQAEIQALPRGRRSAPRGAGSDSHEHRGDARALGRGAQQVAAGDERRRARGRHPDHRLRPALGPEDALDPRAGELRRADLPHGAVAPRRRARRKAGGRDRHRLQRDPDRARDPADRRAPRRLPALARLDHPEDGLHLLRAHPAAVRALPRPAAARPHGDLRVHGAGGARNDRSELAARAVPRGRPPSDRPGDRGRAAARRGDPDG